MITPILASVEFSRLFEAIALTLLWGFIGIFILISGYKVFDWLLKKIDFDEVLKTSPIALAIVISSFILGVSHIVCKAIE